MMTVTFKGKIDPRLDDQIDGWLNRYQLVVSIDFDWHPEDDCTIISGDEADIYPLTEKLKEWGYEQAPEPCFA